MYWQGTFRITAQRPRHVRQHELGRWKMHATSCWYTFYYTPLHYTTLHYTASRCTTLPCAAHHVSHHQAIEHKENNIRTQNSNCRHLNTPLTERVCLCVYIHTRTHAHAHTHTYIYIYIYMYIRRRKAVIHNWRLTVVFNAKQYYMFRPTRSSSGTRSLCKRKRKSCIRHYIILSKFGCKLTTFCLTHTHTRTPKQNL